MIRGYLLPSIGSVLLKVAACRGVAGASGAAYVAGCHGDRPNRKKLYMKMVRLVPTAMDQNSPRKRVQKDSFKNVPIEKPLAHALGPLQ